MEENAGGESLAASMLLFVRAIAFRLVLVEVEASCLWVLLLCDGLEEDPGGIQVERIVRVLVGGNGVDDRPSDSAFDVDLVVGGVSCCLCRAGIDCDCRVAGISCQCCCEDTSGMMCVSSRAILSASCAGLCFAERNEEWVIILDE